MPSIFNGTFLKCNLPVLFLSSASRCPFLLDETVGPFQHAARYAPQRDSVILLDLDCALDLDGGGINGLQAQGVYADGTST